MANFRVLHITDLHIAIPPGEDTLGQRAIWRSREYVYPSCANPWALEAAAEFLFEVREGVDLVLISGDVADDGQQRNLDAALRFIAAPAVRDWYVMQEGAVHPRLDAERDGGPPFFIIPGNHDRFHGVGRLPGGTAFDQTFGAYWERGLGGVQAISLKKDLSTLTLIAADFCLQSAFSGTVYLGQGNAYEDVIAALVEETAAVRATYPNGGIVWVSHFPPLLDVDLSLRLLGAERLINAARDNNVRYVLAGHLHRSQVNTYVDLEVICTGSASSKSIGEVYGFWIQGLDIEVDPFGSLSIALSPSRYKPSEIAFVRQM